MKWHKKLLIIVLLISFIVGLGSFGSFGMKNVKALNPPVTPILIGPNGILLDSCSFQKVSVQFNWYPMVDATDYTIQVSPVSDFSTLTYSYTSSLTCFIAQLDFGTIYYWRVQASNPAGSSGWSNVNSVQVLPAPPQLISPSYNTYNLSNITFTVYTCVPRNVEIQVSCYPYFDYCFIDAILNQYQNAGQCRYSISYTFITGTYFWRTRSLMGNITGPWSSINMFTVIFPPSQAPNLIQPVNSSLIKQTSVRFGWESVAGATMYQVEIANVETETVYTNSFVAILSDNANYLWRVRGGNSVGWGPWSNYSSFRILLPPNTPTLASPFNRTVIQNNNIVVLTWNPIATADSCLVQVVNTGIVQTFEVLSPYNTLNFTGQWGNNYTWRVKAKNASGESSWSNFWVFTIQENIPPKLEIDSYPQYTNQSTITITGKAYDLESGLDALCLGPNSILVFPDGTFKINFNLNEGSNSFTLIAIDKAGNKAQQTIGIVKDTIPPEINITFPIAPIYPSYEGITVISDIKVTGTIKDLLPVTLLINNENCPIDSSGNFAYQTNLNYGLNKVCLKAIDAAGNISEKTLIIYKTINPKFIFKINNPKMQVQVINEQGQLDWVQEEIDPGRYTIPVIVKGRVFIPVRKFIELVNGTVEWDASSQKVTIVVPGRGKTIELWMEKPLARVTDSYGNQQWIQIEKGDNTITPFIKNERSYFPLRFIVEQLNAVVEWNQILQQVIIEFPIVP